MIRSGHARMGLVAIGQGGSALDYNFDANGLSDDPRLPVYLQSLTPGQLQTALTPDPTGEATLQQSVDSLNAYISSGLNCDGTTCGANIPAGFSLSSIPVWLWVAGAGLAAFTVLRK
jgi:hypothetical protein